MMNFFFLKKPQFFIVFCLLQHSLSSGWCSVTDVLGLRLKYAPISPMGSISWMGASRGWERLVDGTSEAEAMLGSLHLSLLSISRPSLPLEEEACSVFAKSAQSQTARVRILLRPLWPWARFSIALGLSLPIWKVAIRIVLTSANLLLQVRQFVYNSYIMPDTE